MATKVLKQTDLPLPGGPASLLWSPGEVYICGDPDCRSKVLVLLPPLKDLSRPALPRCFCGSVLEIGGSVSGSRPSLSGEGGGPDPSEERE